jgi:hypothetical protein
MPKREQRPVYVLHLIPKKGIDGINALKRGEKYLGRVCGLRNLDHKERTVTVIYEGERPMSKMTIRCAAFRAWHRNTLFGFAELKIVELDLTIKDVAIHEKNGMRWAQPPAKPQIKDGVVVKDDAGKAQYVNIFEFGSRAVRDAFSAAAVRAVLEHEPKAFEEQPAAAPKPRDADMAIPF